MKAFQIQIIAQDQLAALERILRVIRHRGGVVSTMTMKTEHTKIYLDIHLITDRAISALQRQLEKLIDVEDVRILEQAA